MSSDILSSVALAYAKVLDKNKQAAVARIDDVFGKRTENEEKRTENPEN